MFWGFVTCEGAKGCDGFGDKCVDSGRAALLFKTSLLTNEKHESSVLE